jgi:hypothetical protein
MTAHRACLAALAVLSVLGAPLSALAKDVCLTDTPGNSWIFQKVKKFKTGRAVPLSGIYIKAGETFPVSGTGVLRPGGNVEVGVFVHAMSEGAFVGNNFTASMQVGTDLGGTGALDSDGDYLVNSGLYGWVVVDCSTITIP